MIAASRRSLARYGANQLLEGVKMPLVAEKLAAALVISERQASAPLLVADIMRELEDRGVVARADLASANALSARLHKQISDYLKQAVKVDDVILNQQIDPALIGGVRIETANRSWDLTVAKKIDDMRKVF
ncbi:F0F1 ATP synthase subunit delta [Candidatus Saccharibacteria bacterium]|nr:F0F1 ATP synthase subunit delta [Candidatus Saccharibacteria bacterium]